MKDNKIRLQKHLSECGIASRRKAEELIAAGKVKVNGHIAERKPDRTVLIFILNEGRNRQIRRMCEAVGLEVLRLKRTEIAGVKLGMLPQGKWRPLNEREMRHLTNITQKELEEK